MTTNELVGALVDLCGPDAVSTASADRAAASRDYAWLSPILSEDLPTSIADVVVRPPSADQLAAIVETARRHGVPVTPRGRGTGNYGQAVPLRGGLVVDLSRCDRVLAIDGGVAHVEAGVTFNALEAAAAGHGLEVPVMPSMTGSTVGGFLSGGNQGIGSIEHGSIWDGWVEELEVVPCRDACEPVVLRGDALIAHLHTYGTTGLVATARIRLAPKRSRTVVFASFGRFADAARAGRALMDLAPPPRVVSVADAELAPVMPRHAGIVAGRALLRAAVTPGTLEETERVVADHDGSVTASDPSAMAALFASIYNHATLRAKRVDPRVCALQVRGWGLLDHEDDVRTSLPDVRLHLDGNAPRRHGPGYSGLLLSTWVDRATLTGGIERLRGLGLSVISPHTWLLGGHGGLDAIRVTAAEADPDGLLNPGKLPPFEHVAAAPSA